MNKKLSTLAIAAATGLTLVGVAHAGSMGYPDTRTSYTTTTTTDFDTSPTYAETDVVTTQPAIIERRTIAEPRIVERRVVTTRPAYIAERDESFGERIVRWPGRAATTVVRSPVIVGETLAGRREVVSDRGFLASTDRDRVIYRQPARRLSSRTVYRTESFPERTVRRTGTVIERGAESTGRGLVRTGRTVVRTPMIVGETLTGERQVINEEGRPFAR